MISDSKGKVLAQAWVGPSFPEATGYLWETEGGEPKSLRTLDIRGSDISKKSSTESREGSGDSHHFTAGSSRRNNLLKCPTHR